MEFKQGDTFDYSGAVEILDEAGDPIDLTNWGVASTVFFPDENRRFSLTAQWLNGQFTHVRLRSAETKSWPCNWALLDIQFTAPDGHVVSSPTTKFKVVEDVTLG